jgi:hypothetical protein
MNGSAWLYPGGGRSPEPAPARVATGCSVFAVSSAAVLATLAALVALSALGLSLALALVSFGAFGSFSARGALAAFAALATLAAVAFAARPPRSVGAGVTGSPAATACLARLTARRLVGPRTGDRSTKTHPTWGTGLPPTRRPGSNSQAYWPWNSWNESFERIVASARSAICRMNASPRPIAPAGGVMISPATTASS